MTTDWPEADMAPALEPAPTPHQLYAHSLREIADFYEAHPEIPLPMEEHGNFAVTTKEDAKHLARALGTFKKSYSQDIFTMSKMFGNINAKFVFYRSQICTAKVVGVETIPARIEPAIPERVVPAQTREVLEWECKSLLEE